MAKMTFENIPKITLAYAPAEYNCQPVYQDIPETVSETWVERLLKSKELMLRPTVLSNIYMVTLKNTFDEKFNWFATEMYLHKSSETIGGDVFFCRASLRKKPNGSPTLLSLTGDDMDRLNAAAEQFYGRSEVAL